MRILITGGLGFLGGRIAAYLHQCGYKVVIGTRKKISKIDWLPNAEIIQLDWDDKESLDEACRGISVVIHAAGMNAQQCNADPIAALKFNGTATRQLVKSSENNFVKQFIYFSTAHVYSSPLIGVITEESPTINMHPYATTHLMGEHAVLEANQNKKMHGVVLRLSNVFGAPMDVGVGCWTLLANDLCKQVAITNKMVMKTSGIQERNFVPMSKICWVIESFLSGNTWLNTAGIFNIGSKKSRPIIEMAKFIQERCENVLGYRPDLLMMPSDIKESCQPLLYQTKQKLKKYPPIFSDEQEIDDLIKFCQLNFSTT